MDVRDNPIYNVLIVGAGQIGAFFDQPSSQAILTHAHAFSRHPGFNLLGFMDQDYHKAKNAVAIWGGEAFITIEDAVESNQVDVVCLAIPDEYHYTYLKKLAHSDIKLIFVEKPLVKTLIEAEEISRLFNESPVAIQVNYSRRFVPEFIDLRDSINNGEYGVYLSGTGYYGKGILHNGSHLIDILRFWLGDICSTTTLTHINDYYEDDPSVSAVLQLQQGGMFFLQTVDCRAYTHFEIDLLFERKRIRIIDSGFKIEEYDVQDSQLYSGYQNLGLSNVLYSSLGQAMFYAADNIYNYINGEKELLCKVEDAYKALRICRNLQEGAPR